MTRTGKIARLPHHIRDQLNRRLKNGEMGRLLVEWLNSLVEVQDALKRNFAGRPINEPNLTEWKQGGYREWDLQQGAMSQAGELAADAQELAAVAHGRMADHLNTVLTARYAVELAAWNGDGCDETRRRLRALRELCHDVIMLQRGNQNAARVKIGQARLDRHRKKVAEDIAESFLNWIEYPEVRNCIYDEAFSRKQRKARLMDIFRAKPVHDLSVDAAPRFVPPDRPVNAGLKTST
jgi:hypothetical protein